MADKVSELEDELSGLEGNEMTARTMEPRLWQIMHEKICGIRWKIANARLRRIEAVVIWAAASLIVGMAGILVAIIFRTARL